MTTVLSPVNIDARKNLDMRPGDTVRVHQKIEEKGKTRIQVFEGLVLSRKHGAEAGATFTVRRSTGGYGVEKIYPLYSPMIDKIEVTKRSKVRRGKLYYIRDKALKQIKKRMKMVFVDIQEEREEAKAANEEKPTEDVSSEASNDSVEAKEENVDTKPEAETTESPETNEAPTEESKEEEVKEETTEEEKKEEVKEEEKKED